MAGGDGTGTGVGVGNGVGTGSGVGGGVGTGNGSGKGGCGGGIGIGVGVGAGGAIYANIFARSTSTSISSNASLVIGPILPSFATPNTVCNPCTPILDVTSTASLISREEIDIRLALWHAFDNLSNMSASSV